MKKLLFVLPVLLFICINIYAQADYKTAIGLRAASFGSGITFKQFLNHNTAIEAIVGTRYKGIILTALYEFHSEPFHADRVWVYFGVGVHAGYFKEKNALDWFGNNKQLSEESQLLLGIDGIIGIEYPFYRAPLCLAFDYKPGINISTSSSFKAFYGNEVAISLRYTFQ